MNLKLTKIKCKSKANKQRCEFKDKFWVSLYTMKHLDQGHYARLDDYQLHTVTKKLQEHWQVFGTAYIKELFQGFTAS